MDSYKVTVDQKLCIGCGVCTANCENFVLEVKENGDLKSKPLKDIIKTDLEEHQLSVTDCPVHCIKVQKIDN